MMDGRDSWWRFDRRVGDIEIFAVDLSPDPARERVAYALLDRSEKDRCRRFRVEEARRQFLLSLGALRRLLSHRTGHGPEALRFAGGIYGKPFALIDGVRASVSFNLSHSGDAGLIALSGTRCVGIDLEQRRARADLALVAANVFGPGERAALAELEGREWLALFYRLWTCKEALIKARGTGFGYHPARFEVPGTILAGGRNAWFGFPEETAAHWGVADIGSDAHAAALAYRRYTDARARALLSEAPMQTHIVRR